MVTSRYIYMKFIGFLLVVLGFSYSLTSFYNFYSYIFGDVTIANANILMMSIGLLIPLYLFIFGVYFYFYADKDITKINKFILITALLFLVLGVFCLFINNSIIYTHLYVIAQIGEFLHVSIGYVLMILAVLIFYGCFKYKF